MACAAPVSASTEGVLRAQLANGIAARIYTADYLAARTIIDSGRGVIPVDGGSLRVITSVEDPLIINKGDGSFHPIPTDLVFECLEAIDYPRLGLSIELYILPYPRAEALSSSAVGSRIFLSPQMLDITEQGAAYMIAHEIGHVFQYQNLPVGGIDWQEYEMLRGILDDERFSDNAAHAYRPREVFAEDFRVLFGGPDAFYGGRIENPELSSPAGVSGLREFCLALTEREAPAPSVASIESYPNPFNPQTELRIGFRPDFSFGTGGVSVRIYDVRGALVRNLYDGRPGADLRIVWDGRDQEGREVASSTYFGVVETGGAMTTTKLLLIK